jgi:hypothetical protein
MESAPSRPSTAAANDWTMITISSSADAFDLSVKDAPGSFTEPSTPLVARGRVLSGIVTSK